VISGNYENSPAIEMPSRHVPGALDPEKVACWYFRLNGFFPIENFVVHPSTEGSEPMQIYSESDSLTNTQCSRGRSRRTTPVIRVTIADPARLESRRHGTHAFWRRV
jgi:hypothetical protein